MTVVNYAILGSGRWGTSLARYLGEREEVYLWGRDEGLIKRIQVDRTNDIYLPGIDLPQEVRATYDLEHVLGDSDVVVLAVPSYAYARILDRAIDYLGSMEAVICGTTGFEPDTGRRLSQEYLERFETLKNYFTITGPALPQELANQQPANLVLCGENEHNRKRISERLYRNYLRFYESEDLAGTEITGAVNNLLAFLGGVVEGLGLDNGTLGSLLTRGIHETKKLIEYEGGRPETAMTLSGLGTTTAIATGPSSRNYRLGVSLGKGKPLEKARSEVSGCLEAIPVARITHTRILKGEIKAPLLTELYGVLHEGVDPYSSIEKIINLKFSPSEG